MPPSSYVPGSRPLHLRIAADAGAAALALYTLYRFREAVLTFFVLDDFWVLRDAHRIQITSLGDVQQLFWFGHQGFRLYRPFTTSAYSYLLQSLFGFDPSAHHAFQLLVFAVIVLLVIGIVRRLTNSTTAGLAAGLIYVLAPGQAVNAYWLSAFTVSGTTVWVLALLWCWLRFAGRTRLVLCTSLQVCGLLASEHAIAAPPLCLLVSWWRREPWRDVAVQVAPSTLIVAMYSIAKLLYLRAAPTLLGTYSVNFVPGAMLEQLGRYVGAFLNVVALQKVSAQTSFVIGIAVLVALLLAVAGAWRRSDAARLIATGVAMFIVSLIPVLVLRAHYYDHYVCTAALGGAVAVIGVCQLLTRYWQGLACVVALALLIVDLQTDERAWRKNDVFLFVVNGSLGSAAWVDAILTANAAQSEPKEYLIPITAQTNSIFAVGEAHTFLPGMPSRITRYRDERRLGNVPFQVKVRTKGVMRLGEPMPFWDPRWQWMRELAGVRDPGRQVF